MLSGIAAQQISSNIGQNSTILPPTLKFTFSFTATYRTLVFQTKACQGKRQTEVLKGLTPLARVRAVEKASHVLNVFTFLMTFP